MWLIPNPTINGPEKDSFGHNPFKIVLMINLSLKICAGGEGKDACDGEGGAPLVCLDKVRSYFFLAATSYLTIWCFCCFLLFCFAWIRCDLDFSWQQPLEYWWLPDPFVTACSLWLDSNILFDDMVILFLFKTFSSDKRSIFCRWIGQLRVYLLRYSISRTGFWLLL